MYQPIILIQLLSTLRSRSESSFAQPLATGTIRLEVDDYRMDDLCNIIVAVSLLSDVVWYLA